MSQELGQEIDEAYIHNFLSKQKMAVLSTVNMEGKPDAAPIYFICDDKFQFSFVTPIDTQKYMNIKATGEIVLTITDEDKKETVRVRAKCEEQPLAMIGTLEKLAIKLSKDLEIGLTLPLLKFRGKKTVIKAVPYEVCLRRFHKEGFAQKIVTF